MRSVLSAVVIASFLCAAVSSPADQTWVGGTADWNLPANWNGGVVPTNENATLNNGGTAQLGAPSANINYLYINNSTLEVNAGGALRVVGDLDFQSSATGTLLVNNGGVFTITDPTEANRAIRNGTTIVNAGGIFNFGASDASFWGRVGNNSATPTRFTINGGTANAQYTEGDGLVIGDYFTTTHFNMTPGSQLNMGGKRLNIGWWNAGVGYFTNIGGAINYDNSSGGLWVGAGHDDSANPARGYLVLGNGASINKIAEPSPANWGDLVIGTRWGGSADNNYGQMEMLAGSTITWQRGAFMVGRDTASTGVVTNNGGTINIPDAFIGIGQGGGNGTMVMNGGTLNHGREDFYVADWNGAVGKLVVNDATINHTANWRFAIGNNNATGTMIVSGASSVVDTGPNEFQVGNYDRGTGTLILNDGLIRTHSWTVTGRDGAGSGHIIINGGRMDILGDSSNGGYMQVVAGVGRAGQTGTWDINGGVLNAAASSGNIEFSAWYDDNNYETFATVNLNGGRLIAGEIWGGNTGVEKHNVFNFNGGILQLNASRTILRDLESANIKAGGAIIETAGFATTVSQALLDGGGGGGLTVRGDGVMYGDNDRNMVILWRTDNTFTGGIVVSDGAHIRIGDLDGNTSDGSLGLGTTILLDNGGIKNNNFSTPVIGAGRTITLGPGGGYFTVGWGDRNMEVQGKITGVGALYVNRDGGNLVLSNPANDYAGNTRIGADGPGRYNGGWQAGLYLGASEVIPNGAGKGDLIIDGGYGGHLNMNGFSETVNGLNSINRGLIYNSSGTAATLTVGDNNANGAYDGTIENNIALTKIGGGTLTLGGGNSYNGGTTLAGGTIVARHTGALGSGAVALGDATTLVLEGPASQIAGLDTGWNVNGSAAIGGGVLTLTPAVNGQAGSAFYETPVNLATNFNVSFVYSVGTKSPNPADGYAIVLQNNWRGPDAIGDGGGGLGYMNGINRSAAALFNIYNDDGTGLGANGAGVGGYGFVAPVALDSGVEVTNTLAYDGTTLSLTLAQGASTFTTNYTGIDIAAIVGAKSAYLGVTGGTGGENAEQRVTAFSFASAGAPAVYGNPVNVAAAANAQIRPTVQAATTRYLLGPLAMGNGATLRVSPAAGSAAGTAYTLEMPDATLGGGTATFDVANNGAGLGTLLLDASSGPGGLVKTGAGMLLLAGNHTYGGPTEVQNGTLRVNGTYSGGGLVTVQSGGTLDGTGQVGNVMVAAGGHVAPGNSIGTLTVNGYLALLGVLDVELDGTGAGFSDLVNVLGTLDIAAATVNFVVGAALDDPAYVFASYRSLNGTEFAAVSNLPSGYQIDYHYGGQQNQVALVIPEPTTLGLLGGAAVLLWLRRRRSGS